MAGEKGSTIVEVSENLRTVEVEAIQHLSADFQPTSSQSPAGITQLVKDLAPFELTKAEKLQIVNLAPTAAVELYVIIEELEDRFGDRMDDILALVRTSLGAPTPSLNETQDTQPQYQSMDEMDIEGQDEWITYVDPENDANNIVFDDTGEGMGVEGDLDMDDD